MTISEHALVRILGSFLVLSSLILPPSKAAVAPPQILNGDSNGDGARDVSDAVHMLAWLFSGGPPPVAAICPAGTPNRDNGDTNGDGARDVSDPVYLLGWLFSGGPEPVELECPVAVVRFAVLGNTGRGNAGQVRVAAALKAKCETDGCDFVQLLGTNIFDEGVESVDDAQWQVKFEEPYNGIDLPFYAILGSQDYGLSVPNVQTHRAQHQVDYTRRSTKWRMPARYYHHSVGDVAFFALDSVPQLLGQDAMQRREVDAWIAAARETWKIAFGHYPYLSNGPTGNAGNYDGAPLPIPSGAHVKSFVEEVLCGKVDLYLSSHDRSLQWLEPTCEGTELAVSGAGASVTELPGANAARFQASELGFIYIAIDGRTLTAEVIDTQGVVRFTRRLQK